MLTFKNLIIPLWILVLLSAISPLAAASKTAKNNDFWLPSFDEMMDHRLPELLDARLSNYFPRMNIQEFADSYHIEAELPGVKKEDIEIKLQDDHLVISGEKKGVREETKNDYRRIERASGSFYRSVSIPRDIDKDKITAELSDGILKIDIAKNKKALPKTERKILIK